MLKVIYDWKPSHCEGCGSLVHPYSLCKANPNPTSIVHPAPKPRIEAGVQARNLEFKILISPNLLLPNDLRQP